MDGTVREGVLSLDGPVPGSGLLQAYMVRGWDA